MSAIFGFVHKARGAVARADDLAPMFAAAAHWGPDGTRTQGQGPAAFGHAALMDCDASLAQQQPLVDARWPYLFLTADVSIDDREGLLDDLGLCGSARRGPDSLLLLEALARWGHEAVDRINGAFALALWDARTHTLFCARDAVGLRPFYYWDGPDRFVFATDVRAILALPGVPRRVDDDAVAAHHVMLSSSLASRSFFHDVHRLRAGHSLLVTPAGTKQHRWWEPGRGPDIRLATIGEYVEALRAEMNRAVALRVRSPDRVGSHLSGGLDSSAVTALAARALRAAGRPDPLVYSWSPASEGSDPKAEGHIIRQMLDHTGLRCTFTDLRVEDVADALNRDFTVEPIDTVVFERTVCRQAAADGVRVMLSGWGGDEGISFNGRGHLANLAGSGRWWTLRRELACISAASGSGVLRAGFSRVLKPWMPGRLYLALHSRTPQGRRAAKVVQALSATDPRLAAAALRLLRERFLQAREGRSVRRIQRGLLLGGHLASRLESWAWLGAPLRVTYRYPLLDRRLLDFGLRLPPAMYFQLGWKRFLFRTAIDGIVPSPTCWNPTKADPEALAMLTRLSGDATPRDDPDQPELIKQQWRVFLSHRDPL